MKTLNYKAAGLALMLALSPAAAKAIEVYKSDTASVDIGGRFQMTGHLQHTDTSGPAKVSWNANVNNTVGLRDSTRIFLFQNQNRIEIKGTVDGIKFNLVEALGGEGLNGSNNQINLIEMNATIPVFENVSLMTGLFRNPVSRASALDDAFQAFSEKSYVNNWFFNAGYDNGLALNIDSGLFDAILGTSLGTPNIPVRYLPVIFQLPPPMFARIGVGNLKEDPYHPTDLPSTQPEETKWAVHASGQYIRDSNAGHSSLLGQPNGQITVPSVQSYYGNAFLASSWNPYLGLRRTGNGPVNQVYWNAALDAQLQLPVGENTLSLSGQLNYAQFINFDFAPTNVAGQTFTSGQLSATGAEIAANLMAEKWGLGLRADVTLPDAYFISRVGNNTLDHIRITDSLPIYEITFPSIIYKHSQWIKVVAETQFWLNAPEVLADSGTFELLDEVTQVSAANRNNPVIHNTNVVMNGRIMLQVDF